MKRKLLGAVACVLTAAGVATVHSGSVGAAGAAGSTTAAGLSGYTLNRLPVLPGTVRSEATAVDPAGDWIGGEIGTSDGQSHVVLWHDGQLTELTGIAVNYPRLTAVGPGGFAVGTGSNSEGWSRAFMISGGGYFELPLPADAVSASAAGLDVAGDVAGTVTDAAGLSRVVVWPGNQFGTVHELPVPAGYQGFAVGMAPDGTVAAQATQDWLTFRSFSWDASGARHELLAPTSGEQAFVQDVAGGFAVGFAFDPVAGTSRTVRWALPERVGRVAPQLASTSAVNAHGDYAGQNAAGAAAVVRHRRVIVLPGLAANRASGALGLADNGTAVGFSRDAAGTVTAVTWTREG